MNKRNQNSALARSAYILQKITGNANIDGDRGDSKFPTNMNPVLEELNLLLLLAQLGPAAGIGLLLLLLLQEHQSVDLVADGVLRADGLLDLLAADEGGDNAGTDDEGQHEAVHAVPVRSTAGGGGTSVGVVQEGEGEELADQRVLDGEEQSRPGHGGCNNTGDVAAVAVLAAVASPLETPVDGTEEGEDLSQAMVSKMVRRDVPRLYQS